MGNTLDTLNHLLEEEGWTPLRTPEVPRVAHDSDMEFLARCIRLTVGHCSMASWGLPYEAIASAWLLGRGTKKR